MIQSGFWAEPLYQLEPLPRSTAHCAGIGVDQAGHKYAVKFATPHALLPITEAFCHRLAAHCGIAVPEWTPVEWGGAIGFGSRWLPGVISDASARWQAYWRSEEPGAMAPFFGRCCALDGFLHNPDRHYGNFLLQQGRAVLIQPHGGDYSCAWWMTRWPPHEQLARNTGSSRTYRNLQQRSSLDLGSAATTLERLARIDAPGIERMMDNLPSSWCPQQVRDDLLTWWSSPARMTRIDTLQTLISRGQLPL